MHKSSNSDIIVRKWFDPLTLTNKYLLEIKVLHKNECDIPDDYVAAIMMEELRRVVNSSTLEQVVFQNLGNMVVTDKICPECGRVERRNA